MTNPPDPGFVPPPPPPPVSAPQLASAPYTTPQPYPNAQPYPAPAMWVSPPPVKKKRRAGWAIAGTLVVLVAVGGAVGYLLWQNATETQYSEAVADLNTARADVTTANEAAATVVKAAEVMQNAGNNAEHAKTTELMDDALRQTFVDMLVELDTALEAVPEELAEPRAAGEMPDWPWERTAAAEELAKRTETIRAEVSGYESDVAAVSDAMTNVDTAAAPFFASATSYSETYLADKVAAENYVKVVFIDRAEDVARYTELNDDSALAVAVYADGAAMLVTSLHDELDEKVGPLMPARLEIEQFARDLAPGLMLDFDWEDIVAGAGEGLTIGGTTYWWMDPGYATITLSNSNAALWGTEHEPMVRALVAHEVGHALTVRCGDMYDWSTQESIEQWATAWAIVQGYTGEGNGVSVYGEPPQSMIDAARGCS